MIRSLVSGLVLTLALPLAAAAQSAPGPAIPPIAASPADGAPAAAQPQAQPHHHHSRYMAALRSLALTADQKSQIRGFVRDTKQANAGADTATRHANVKHLRQEIVSVLTDDQRSQLRAALAASRAGEAAR